MKKIFLIILAGIIGFYSFSLAWNEFTYENAKKIATEYIANSSFDENWLEQNPTLAWEGKYFYTESEKPSYIEFKVSCDKNPDCGFIMVNFDGDDVAIPIASTSGNTPSEVLSAKNESKIEENMLYYFSPFEQYAENKRNGNISSIDPQDDFWYEVSEKNKLSLQEVKTKKNNTLKEKIESSKKEAKTFKKSVEFKEIKKELKEKKQTNGKEEVSFKYLDMAVANYTPPASSNKFVYGSSSYGAWTSTCYWQVPCYHQIDKVYNGNTCLVGCTPTAMWIIFGYYDRLWIAGNLLPNFIATNINDGDKIDHMIKMIWDHMETTCSGSLGWTNPAKIVKWLQYAKDKGYTWTNGSLVIWNTSTLFQEIKSEINSLKPIIVNTADHSMVAFWYYNSTISSAKIIRVNLGFWHNSKITWTNGIIYYWSNIDYHMDSLYFSWQNQYWILNAFKFTLSY